MSNLDSRRNFLKYTLLASGCMMLNPASETFGKELEFLLNIDLMQKQKTLWKWHKEAEFYTMTPRGIKCRKCPNECYIKAPKDSICRTKIVKDEKLYNIAYGNPCAIHVDPIEKKPLFHFYPSSTAFSIATAGCILGCLNCQNWSISQKSPFETTNYDLFPEKVVEQAAKYKCRSIAYTYSDPIAFYEYTYDTSKLAREKGIKNVLVTSGYINKEPLQKLCKVSDAANVDLKSFSEDIYLKLNAGELQPVLDTLKIMKDEGVWLEITNLVVPTWTDKTDMIKKMCAWLADNGFIDTPLHFSRFHPQYKLKQLPVTPVKILESARAIAKAEGVKYVYIGNDPGNKAVNTWCPNKSCRKLLIERTGFTITKNNIENSKCRFCGEKIAGFWK